MAAIDRIVLNVIKKFEQRADVGLKKYGVNLEREDLTTLDWINEAQQEAMDFCLYLERLRVDIEKQQECVEMFSNDEVFKLICDLNYDIKIDEAVNIEDWFEKYKKQLKQK